MGRDLVYLGFLMPYVLVSYYDRYKYPIMGAEVLLLVWGIDRLVRWAAGSEPERQRVEILAGARAPTESRLAVVEGDDL